MVAQRLRGDCDLESRPQVCFIDWTSGSTGKPKGMATTMWRMSHWVRWRAFHFPLAKVRPLQIPLTSCPLITCLNAASLPKAERIRHEPD